MESEIQPAWIFQPKTREEVSTFLRIIKPPVATGATFAIRAGGCVPAPGCTNLQDGITLGLGLLTGVELRDGVVCVGAR
jgi:hypothetical protein